MSEPRPPLAVYYEHPEWFRPLFAELDARATPYIKVDAAQHRFDPGAQEEPFALLFNRMSASAYLRGHANAVFYTRHYLRHLERNGVRVVNGSRAFDYETSKALQLSLFASLGLEFPRTRVVNSLEEVREAARELTFPLVVKPNIGGRGAGIVRFESREDLEYGLSAGLVELGIDSTALVQEYIQAGGGHIVRVETLAGRFLYAMKVTTSGENFNLCPAEICDVERASESAGVSAVGEMCLADAPKVGLKVERYEPPVEIVEKVERIAAAASLDLGGVEYLIDERDGRPRFYDINALSNFVADAVRVVGFDPHARLVDYLEEEVRRCVTATGFLSSAAG
ncbi:MAG: RimK family alpha-L-glutamate ligase [Pyrinomonadaceae bacterium]